MKKKLFLIYFILLSGFALFFTVTSAQEERTVDSVYRIAWSPGGDQIAFANFRNLYVWDFVTKHFVLKQNLDETMPLSSLRWSADEIHLAANSYAGKTLKIWDVKSNKLILTVNETTASYGLDWTPDGQQILTASTGLDNVSEISRWDAATGRLLGRYDTGAVAIYRSPDSQIVATLSDVKIILRDAITLEVEEKLDKDANTDDGFLASSVAWSPNGQLLAGGYQNGIVHLWDTASVQLINQFKANEQVYADVIKHPADNGSLPSDIAALAFSSDSKSVWVFSYDGTLRQWDIATEKFVLDQHIETPVFVADWGHDTLAIGVNPVIAVTASVASEVSNLSLEELGLKIITPISSNQ